MRRPITPLTPQPPTHTKQTNKQPPSSSEALQCVILLSSVRRSLFATDKERAAFLQQLVSAIREILQTEKGLEYQVRFFVCVSVSVGT